MAFVKEKFGIDRGGCKVFLSVKNHLEILYATLRIGVVLDAMKVLEMKLRNADKRVR